MEQTNSTTTPPPIFSLPLELRTHIYGYLISLPVINVDFCEALTQERLTNGCVNRKSPIMALFEKKRAVMDFVRIHGLHLAVTSPLLREEFIDFLRQSGTEFRVHCHECFQRICSCLSTDLGISFPFLKKIVTKLEFSSTLVSPYPGIYATLSNFKHVADNFFGNQVLLDYISSQPRYPREWFIVVKTIIGKITNKRRLHYQHEPNIENEDPETDDVTDFDDNDDGVHSIADQVSNLSQEYVVRSDVEPVTTEIHSWNVTKTAWNDSWLTPPRSRILDRIMPTTCTDKWRYSASLTERWKGRGPCRLVCRDEIHIELDFL